MFSCDDHHFIYVHFNYKETKRLSGFTISITVEVELFLLWIGTL